MNSNGDFHLAVHSASAENLPPLVIDVDGTLIATDLLHETALNFIGRHPLHAWRLFFWLISGRAKLKCELSRFCHFDVSSIPLRDETVKLMKVAQSEGRAVYLASASEQGLVEALAKRIGGIRAVFASTDRVNLKGSTKAARLVQEFGRGGFDYVGNSAVDHTIWAAARKVYAVSGNRCLDRYVLRNFPHAEIIARHHPRLVDYIKALRPHQWTKNSLVFMALIAGHHFRSDALFASILAFVCFSMAASSAYIINDLLDLAGDRAHLRKRNRPFAAGVLPLSHGVVLAGLLGCAAFAGSVVLSVDFAEILALYLTSTLAYSLILKRKVIIDIVVLGGLYTIRVLGGLVAIGAQDSPWLLMFSLFLFLSLATVKRCSELSTTEMKQLTNGRRGYHVEDLRVLFPFGAAAGYVSVLVLALYMGTPEVRALYSNPTRLWLVCPLLIYWISRLFVLSNRNELHDDPVVFALTDRVSIATGMCLALVLTISL